MKTIETIIYSFILILFASCDRDLDQSKRYSDMKSESDNLITQANLIINEQKATADSLRNIRDNIFMTQALNYKLSEINRKITNAAEIASKFEDVKRHLEAIRLFASNGEKVTKRLLLQKKIYSLFNYNSDT